MCSISMFDCSVMWISDLWEGKRKKICFGCLQLRIQDCLWSFPKYVSDDVIRIKKLGYTMQTSWTDAVWLSTHICKCMSSGLNGRVRSEELHPVYQLEHMPSIPVAGWLLSQKAWEVHDEVNATWADWERQCICKYRYYIMYRCGGVCVHNSICSLCMTFSGF